nr:vegetative cell wall protein gp1-like [Procambarus clarkii]
MNHQRNPAHNIPASSCDINSYTKAHYAHSHPAGPVTVGSQPQPQPPAAPTTRSPNHPQHQPPAAPTSRSPNHPQPQPPAAPTSRSTRSPTTRSPNQPQPQPPAAPTSRSPNHPQPQPAAAPGQVPSKWYNFSESYTERDMTGLVQVLTHEQRLTTARQDPQYTQIFIEAGGG